jgi:hypothetical protein
VKVPDSSGYREGEAMTLEELLEIESIKQMRYLYSHYYDGNMLDELVSLFTDRRAAEDDEIPDASSILG